MPGSKQIGLASIFAVAVVCGAGGWVLTHLSTSIPIAVDSPHDKAPLDAPGPDARLEHTQLEAEMAKDLKLGMPIYGSDQASRPVIAETPAIRTYNRIMQRFDEISQKTWPKIQVTPAGGHANTPLTHEQNVALRDRKIEALQPVFDLLPQLDSPPVVDHKRAGTPSFDGISSDISDLELWIVQKANYDDRKNNWRGALADVRYGAKLAGVFREAPDLMGLSVQSSQTLGVLGENESLIRRHERDGAFLRRAAAQISAAETRPDIRKHLRDQIALTLQLLPQSYSFPPIGSGQAAPGASQGYAGTVEFSGATPPRPPASEDELQTRLLAAWRNVWVSLPKDPRDWGGVLQALRRVCAEQQADHSPMNAYNRQWFDDVNLVGLTTVGEETAGVRLLEVSIKLLEQRIDTGVFPDRLPAHLGTMAIDPFAGKPLQYRREGSGFILYSIGPDGADDGGRARDPADPPGAPYDLVIEFN